MTICPSHSAPCNEDTDATYITVCDVRERLIFRLPMNGEYRRMTGRIVRWVMGGKTPNNPQRLTHLIAYFFCHLLGLLESVQGLQIIHMSSRELEANIYYCATNERTDDPDPRQNSTRVPPSAPSPSIAPLHNLALQHTSDRPSGMASIM